MPCRRSIQAVCWLALLLHGLPVWCPAAEKLAYVETESLPAPEAIQAAAADERFVYAIDNTVVAKYDRASGKLLARSRGEAKHLNSGFLWQGKLYAAHSNFPRKPEQSQLKVLDLQSMVLETWHDFGSDYGSLTWAVHYQGSWWCNFAHYGDQNAKTCLVRFDDGWKEAASWTYPQDVIAELGRYSISGGLWLDDTLLATGHDHRRIYRLKAPAGGGVLELIDRVKSPFPGQGLAIDPAGGGKEPGLVGIDRGRRKVVFARLQPSDESKAASQQ